MNLQKTSVIELHTRFYFPGPSRCRNETSSTFLKANDDNFLSDLQTRSLSQVIAYELAVKKHLFV